MITNTHSHQSGPERFQECKEEFDIILTVEEKVILFIYIIQLLAYMYVYNRSWNEI